MCLDCSREMVDGFVFKGGEFVKKVRMCIFEGCKSAVKTEEWGEWRYSCSEKCPDAV